MKVRGRTESDFKVNFSHAYQARTVLRTGGIRRSLPRIDRCFATAERNAILMADAFNDPHVHAHSE